MRKYFSLIKIKFLTNIQYKVATFSGIINQFVWGTMKVFLYSALYNSGCVSNSVVMSFSELTSYIWLEQLLLPLVAPWMIEINIIESIKLGNIGYDLLKPIDLYSAWFCQILSGRCSKAIIRCLPVFFFIFFLPTEYRLSLPISAFNFILFIFSLILTLILVTAINMYIYILTIITFSSVGVKLFFSILVNFCSGNVIPLPFFSKKFMFFLKLTPFYYMQNIPFRIYSGNFSENVILQNVFMQFLWIIITVLIGRFLIYRIRKKITIQGG